MNYICINATFNRIFLQYLFVFVLAVYAGPQNAPIWSSRNSLTIYIKTGTYWQLLLWNHNAIFYKNASGDSRIIAFETMGHTSERGKAYWKRAVGKVPRNNRDVPFHV